MVEGARASKLPRRHSNDRVHRFVNSLRKFSGGDAQYGHTMLLQPSVAANIALGPIAHVMANSVDLDRQPRPRAIKVQHIRSDGMLATKDWLSRSARAQPVPQSRFRHRHSAPKALGVTDYFLRRSHCVTSEAPSTILRSLRELRMVPLRPLSRGRKSKLRRSRDAFLFAPELCRTPFPKTTPPNRPSSDAPAVEKAQCIKIGDGAR